MSLVALFDLPSEQPDAFGVAWGPGSLDEANDLLRRNHYLGPLYSGGAQIVIAGRQGGEVVACQVWRRPTARHLPNGGTWLELSRWCLTPEAGPNAGSRCHREALPHLRALGAKTLVSYSDPSAGHTGSLYRACNWVWAPHWERLRPPPGFRGWTPGKPQAPKDRWIFHVTKHDPRRSQLFCDDRGAVRHWLLNGTDEQRRWATLSPYMQGFLTEASA